MHGRLLVYSYDDCINIEYRKGNNILGHPYKNGNGESQPIDPKGCQLFCCVVFKDDVQKATEATVTSNTSNSTTTDERSSMIASFPSWPTDESVKDLFQKGKITVDSLTKTSVSAFSRGKQVGQINVVPMDGKQVKDTTAIAFEAMKLADFKDQHILTVISGFRSQDKQQSLYSQYLAGTGNLAAKPGYSNHQDGRAIDTNPEVGNNYAWLAKNGASFGFCRTVPSERWHWEYRPPGSDQSSCISA